MELEERQLCLVTGGRGFLARHLVLRLINEGKWIVRIADLAPKLILSKEEIDGPLDCSLRNGIAQYMAADVRDRDQILRCCTDVAVVFHLAAPNSGVEDRLLHLSVTVQGTQNVIDACQSCGVRKLIYTSSPSVVMEGCMPLVDVDESLPYARNFNDVYSEMKAQAEALVLEANRRGGMLTCAIRPFGMFGPGDQLALPAFIGGAQSWKMKFILGDGRNLFDWTYVENVAHAHICAERALDSSREEAGVQDEVSGQAYFITDGQPQSFWTFVGNFLSALGYPRPRSGLPTFLLLPAAHVAAWFSRKTGIGAGHHFTPARVRLVTRTCTFDISRARQRLGYEPVVSMDESMRRTVASFAHRRAGTTEAGTNFFPWSSNCVTAIQNRFISKRTVASLTRWMLQWQLVCILLLALCIGVDLWCIPYFSKPLLSSTSGPRNDS